MLYTVKAGGDKTASEKQAVGVLGHALGMTAGGHFGVNALGRAAHHASNIGEVLAHRGLQHGLLGQRVTPSRLQSLKSIFGPEAMVNYEAALQAGGKLVSQYPAPQARNAAIQAAMRAKQFAEGAPVAGDLMKAFQHELAGTAPTFQGKGLAARLYGGAVDRLSRHTLTGMETGAQRAVKHITGAAPAAAFVAADAAASGGLPLGAIGHAAWNGVRQGVGHTRAGQEFVKKEFQKGFQGKMPSKAQEFVADHVFSPAFLDARRLGYHARTQVQKNPRAAAAVSQIGAVAPQLGSLIPKAAPT